jgi:hypothetical protein
LRRRQLAEFGRSDDALASLSAFHLMLAFGQLQCRHDLPPVSKISTSAGFYSSAYPWNVATIDGVGTIQLCPDSLGDGEGITPDLLLHVIDLPVGRGDSRGASSSWLRREDPARRDDTDCAARPVNVLSNG